MRNNNYLIVGKINHLLIIASLSIVIITSIFNTTLFSKESLMQIIEYALSASHSEMSPVDSLFVARVIRQQLWQVHFFVGLFLLASSLSMFYVTSKIKALPLSVKLNLYIVLYMATIGTLLFFRRELNFSGQSIEYLRIIHWVGIYAIVAILVFHVYERLHKRSIA